MNILKNCFLAPGLAVIWMCLRVGTLCWHPSLTAQLRGPQLGSKVWVLDGWGRSADEELCESLMMHIHWGMPKLCSSGILPRGPLLSFITYCEPVFGPDPTYQSTCIVEVATIVCNYTVLFHETSNAIPQFVNLPVLRWVNQLMNRPINQCFIGQLPYIYFETQRVCRLHNFNTWLKPISGFIYKFQLQQLQSLVANGTWIQTMIF